MFMVWVTSKTMVKFKNDGETNFYLLESLCLVSSHVCPLTTELNKAWSHFCDHQEDLMKQSQRCIPYRQRNFRLMQKPESGHDKRKRNTIYSLKSLWEEKGDKGKKTRHYLGVWNFGQHEIRQGSSWSSHTDHPSQQLPGKAASPKERTTPN